MRLIASRAAFCALALSMSLGWTSADAVTSTNVALAANGGTATASTTLHATNYPASAVNNGDRKGLNWGSGGGWASTASTSVPDYVQVAFNSSKTIDRVDVITIQDSYGAPAEPTATMSFSQYGIRTFSVEYWDGTNWSIVGGGCGQQLPSLAHFCLSSDKYNGNKGSDQFRVGRLQSPCGN